MQTATCVPTDFETAPGGPRQANARYTGPVTMSKQLAPHQQRVVDEKRELDDRREKLMAFFSTPIFHGLPESEQIRLERQAVVMRSYSEILGERIAAF